MPNPPYMPDSARARMPQGPHQPLPPYLREDFAQSLDRERPHELAMPVVNGKALDPNRSGNLHYRYLDNGEPVCVPNVWYNQPKEMRISWWEFEVERTSKSLKQAQEDLKLAEACDAPYYMGERTEKVVRNLRWTVEDRQRLADNVQQVLEDVRNGVRFL
jgi:hypothetical protein